ncbi:MAG: hypothetical protein ACFFDH_00475 [Promethearchaeota archaeon]
MMDLDSLKEYIGDRIEELTSLTAYSKQANEGASYPYVIFILSSSSFPVRNRQDWICEIDFWDDTNDSSVIAAKAELLKAGFNYYWQSETEGFYQSHIIFEGEIPTGTPDISRINQRYLLKVR